MCTKNKIKVFLLFLLLYTPFCLFQKETLTGFKWMGNRTVELEKMGKTVLFAYEEAIGFMCGSKVRDKDGISAGIHLAELAAYLETMGLTLPDLLNEIYIQYATIHFIFQIFI